MSAMLHDIAPDEQDHPCVKTVAITANLLSLHHDADIGLRFAIPMGHDLPPWCWRCCRTAVTF
jgi:hypothetical protein